MDGEASADLVIPEHQLLKCIGRGSYGQVWLARNAMGMYRAVKVVFRKSFSSDRPYQRELSGIRTFEPISRSHEGFVDVLQVGKNEVQGYFYYIMELGDDEASGQNIDPEKYTPKTLSSEISPAKNFSLEQCLRLGIAITDALAELHRHELVHRDIKPSNVIFVNGVPKLADIGLVATLKEAHSYVGTEGFIPPEGPGTPQADLYSLGKVLYEVSTGKDRHEFPVLPEQWSESPEYAGLLELNEVILHSCDQNPAKRYASAWDMHGELLLVLNGKSVRRLRNLERRLVTVRRIGGLALGVLLLGAIILYNVSRERRVAADLRQHQITSDIGNGTRAMDSGDSFGSLPLFADALKLEEGVPERETADRLRLGSVLSQCPKMIRMWSLSQRANDACFSPDGKMVACAIYDSQAMVFDLEKTDLEKTQMYLHPFGGEDNLRTVAFSPDGNWILTSGQKTNSPAYIWDAHTLEMAGSLPHPGDAVFQARFSPDGKKIITGTACGKVRIWDFETKSNELTLDVSTNEVSWAGYSRDGTLIGTAARDNNVKIWQANGVGTPRVFHHSTWVSSVDFNPDNTRVVVACLDLKAHVWDLTTGEQLMPELPHDDAVGFAQYSPDGRLILTASNDNTVRLWRAEDLLPAFPTPILRHSHRVMHASFSTNGHQIVTSCLDGTVRVWELAGSGVPPARAPRSLAADAGKILSVSNNVVEVFDIATEKRACPAMLASMPIQRAFFNDNGRFLYTVGTNCPSPGETNFSVQVWDASRGSGLGKPIVVTNGLNLVKISDDGTWVVLLRTNYAQVWDVQSGSAISPPMVHPDVVTNGWLSPAKDLLVIACDTNACLWNPATARQICEPLQHPIRVYNAEISRDGKCLVTCCRDTTLANGFSQVWDTRTGAPIGRRLWHGDGVIAARFSPDAKIVATAGEDYAAKVWDTKTGRQLGLPVRHHGQVKSVDFSTDKRWMLTASEDKTARVWETENKDPLTPPLYNFNKINLGRFLPDQRHIATMDYSGCVAIFALPVDERPVADLLALASFLSGGDVSSLDQDTGYSEKALEAQWESLRKKHPEDFRISPEQVIRWYEFKAEEAESEHKWFAASFHLKNLLEFRPRDASVSNRLAAALEKMKSHSYPGSK